MLHSYAEAVFQQRRTDRATAMRKLVSEAAAPHGGNVAELVKATRPKP